MSYGSPRKEVKRPSARLAAVVDDAAPPAAISRDDSESDHDSDADGDLRAHQGAFAENLAFLLEKKTATRAAAFNKLIELCQEHVLGEWLAGRTEAIFAHVTHRIRSSTGEELAAAATLLALLFVQLPNGLLVDRMAGIRTMLTDIVEDPACEPPARAACLTTLALATTFAGQEYFESAQVMKVMEPFFRSVLPDIVIVAAVDAWSLLLTDLPEEQAVLEGERVAATLAALIANSASDLTVRVTCGDALALLHEQAPISEEILTDEFLAALHDLATESNKQKSKKELKEQHAIFRRVSAALEGGEPFSPETVALAGEAVVVDSFATNRRLRAFRDLLGTGLPEHARANARLRTAFDLGAVVGTDATPAAAAARTADKRARMQEFSERNKDRSSDRKKDRATKAADAAFLHDH